MDNDQYTSNDIYNQKLLSVALNRISGLISANIELEALLLTEKEKTTDLEKKLENLKDTKNDRS